ncbi:MAG: hypothetical protein AAGD28_08100, partial [Bacteroidota bacterium]
VQVYMNMRKGFEGFSQGDPQASLVFNGSFGSIDEYVPVLGFDDAKSLRENRSRLAHDLPRLSSLLAEDSDVHAQTTDAYRADAIPSPGSMKIGTDENQLPIGSGKALKSWKEDGRSYTQFAIDSAESLNWHIGTGPYTILGEGSSAEVFHLPKHPFNCNLYRTIINKATKFHKQQLGSFPYESVRLYEIPFYQDEIYAFAQGIAISEKEGWIADTTGLKERAYLHFTIAQALAQQWVQHHLRVSDVQGAEMIKLALPGALALQFVKDELGEEAVEHLSEQMMKIYNKERFNDPIGEPPLLRADGKDYLEQNLGSLALYDWSKELGLPTFAVALKNQANSSEWTRFSDLYRNLLNLTSGEERKSYWRTRFETVPE